MKFQSCIFLTLHSKPDLNQVEKVYLGAAVFQGIYLLCYGVKQHHIIECRVPVCYFMCLNFKVSRGRLLSPANTGKRESEVVKRHLSSDNSIPIHVLPYAASIMIIAWAK